MNQMGKSEPRQYIISIRPEWIRLILSGEKIMEVRLSRPQGPVRDVVVWLYETKAGQGRGRIVGLAQIASIREWNVYRNPAKAAALAKLACMTVEQLEAYQRGHSRLAFWELADVRELTEAQAPTLKQLGAACPPQSWRSVKRGCEICL